MCYQNSIRFFNVGKHKYKSFHELAKDVNFGVILNYMASEDKDDIPWITNVVSVPMLEEQELGKRQDLIRFLCGNPAIIDEAYRLIKKFYDKYSRMFKLVENGKKEMDQCSSTAASCIELLQCLSEFVSSFSGLIKKYNLSEIKEFSTLCSSFSDFANSPFCGEMASCIDSYKKEGQITFQISIGQGFKFSNIAFDSIDCTKERNYVFLPRKKDGSFLYRDDSVCAGGMALANYFLVNLVKDNWLEFQEWVFSFEHLRSQSAFLYGSVKLYKRGLERGFYFSYPQLANSSCEMKELYELSLAFQTTTFPITNDVRLTNKKGLVVTGTNQGGKSTFLRSLGIAQLMYQCGMYVPAAEYSSKRYRQIFSHFTKREDSAMNTGRFEEELIRMEYILQNAEEGSLILSNETFCGTTEVTATQVAMAIAEGIKDYDIDLWMVTHISQFAINLYNQSNNDYVFLSAAHKSEGQEPFKMIEKKPDNTSFGMELFQSVLFEE